MRKQTSFETLAALFEGSGASGAERAYKRAVENLTLELVKLGQLHCVRLRQISVQHEGKKITAAAYAYQLDNGGAWGEIQFDLEKGTAWVETFAENDPCDTWQITDEAITAVLACNADKMPKKMLIPITLKSFQQNWSEVLSHVKTMLFNQQIKKHMLFSMNYESF